MGDYLLRKEEVVNNAYTDYLGLLVLIPRLKESTAKAIINEIANEMKTNNEFYFNTRPRLIPTRKIVEKYNIDVNLIRREANKMRRD